MEFNYKKEIEPINSALCEADDLKAEANAGQMREILKELKVLVRRDPRRLASLIRYFYAD